MKMETWARGNSTTQGDEAISGIKNKRRDHRPVWPFFRNKPRIPLFLIEVLSLSALLILTGCRPWDLNPLGCYGRLAGMMAAIWNLPLLLTGPGNTIKTDYLSLASLKAARIGLSSIQVLMTGGPADKDTPSPSCSD